MCTPNESCMSRNKRPIAAAAFLIAVLIAAIVALSVLLSRKRNVPADKGVVVVVGAGMAGARAALELHRQEQPFIIIEAQPEVGGRLLNSRFANRTVENGANWIHDYGTKHELGKLARDAKLQMVPTNYNDHLFYRAAQPLEDTARWRRLRDAWNKAIPKADDETVLQALAKYGGWRPETPLDCALLQFAVGNEHAIPIEQLAAWQVAEKLYDEMDPATEQFVTDPRGYRTLVNELLRQAGINNTNANGPRLELEAPVDTIVYNATHATVYLRDGRLRRAKAVICTVSVGVLQSNVLEFKPPLPERKKKALSKLAMSSYVKYFIRFRTALFGEADPMLMIPTNCTYAITVHNLNKKPFFTGSNAVLVTLHAMPRSVYESDVLAFALRAVRSVTNKPVTKDMVAEHTFKNLDFIDYFRGAYSNRLVGFGDADLQALRKAEGALFLAGEAFGIDDYGSVKSALDSGRETARRVLDMLASR